MADQPHSHSLRTGRHTQAGQIYLLTSVTADRQPVFADFQAARCLIRCLQQAALLRQADTLAFVVMPDHLHWLMQLGEQVPLAQCMRNVKTLSALRIGAAIWQAGYHDHAVRQEDSLPDIARYIVANPVRAGLVSRTGLYPHWDAVWLGG